MSSPDYDPKTSSNSPTSLCETAYSMPEIPLEHRFIDTNGVRLHVVMAGPSDGQPLLFLHGFPENWWGWRAQIPYFAGRGYRVIVPDQRGYNLSDKPRPVAAYHIDTLADDVIGLLDQLEIERVGIVGHDWGANVTWWVTASFPERFSRAVTLNGPHPRVFSQILRSSPKQMAKSWYAALFLIPVFPEWFGRVTRYRTGQRLMQKFSARPGTFSDLEMENYREAWGRPGAMRGMLNWYRAFYRNRPQLKEPIIDVPMRLIWGKQDVALTQQMAAPSIEKYCSRGDVVFLEYASHWVQHDEPAAVNRLIEEWVTADIDVVSG